MASKVLTRELLMAVRERYVLDLKGIHGPAHWARVRENGLRIARESDADETVVELFAYIHDSCREHDGTDARHGERAAAFAEELATSGIITATPRQMKALVRACTEHSRGGTTGPPTVVACWDADRLDLGRCGIKPDPRRLCTKIARRTDVLAWAYGRSLGAKKRRHK
jgi:uncharacterized protein